MVHLLAWWLAIQLVAIGYGYGSMLEAIHNGTHKCSETIGFEDPNNKYWAMAIPLVFFVQPSPELDEYCAQQKEEAEYGIY